MRKCNGHLSNKNVLSNFMKEFLLREESFNLAGRSFQIVGPETLNDLGPNVIVLVLGMYSCPDVADRNCLRPGIDEIATQSAARKEGAEPFKHWCIKVAILKIILCSRGNQ